MDVRAIIILGGAAGENEKFAGVPLASLDVLGRSVMLRVVDRLTRFGIGNIAVISDRALQLPSISSHLRLLASQENVWQTAVQVLCELANGGADLILALRLGPYAELDYDHLIQFHLEQHRPVTVVLGSDEDQPSAFLFNTSPRNEALYLLRHQLQTARHPHSVYSFVGYFNRLRSAADLRRLAVDSFCHNAELAPVGVEVKPGIWIASGAVIHDGARIVAPAYIGPHAKLRTAAVVTRCSVLEHHAQVSAGVVLDDATILANTKIGPALDVAHAVVGFSRLAHLRRKVEVDIHDDRLVGSVSSSAVQLLQQFASMAAILPARFVRGLASSNRSNGRRARVPSAQSLQSELTRVTQTDFPAHFAEVRRYGND
jgi:carbonic anhydrase/acetyltransferase-like protein (isoleucine patch superfamily)